MEQWCIARQPLAAVVAGEDHERIRCELQSIERPEYTADPLVGAFEHRDVVCARTAFEIVIPTALPFWQIRPLIGPVRRVVGDFEKERPTGALLDECFRSARDFIR